MVPACVWQAHQDTESFIWILQQFDNLRGPGAPPISVVFTDQDPAMAAAIRSHWRDITHLLCIWHIMGKNLVSNMKGFFSSECSTHKVKS